MMEIIEENGIKKMILIFSFIIVISAIVTFTMYFTTFTGGKSLISSDWGNFGAYIGGVLTPLLSILSILIIIYNLNKQIISTKNMQFENRRIEKYEKIYISISKIYDQVFFVHNFCFQSLENRSLNEKIDILNVAKKVFNEEQKYIIPFTRLYGKNKEIQKEIRRFINYIQDFFSSFTFAPNGRTVYPEKINDLDFEKYFDSHVITKWFDMITDFLIKDVAGENYINFTEFHNILKQIESEEKDFIKKLYLKTTNKNIEENNV